MEKISGDEFNRQFDEFLKKTETERRRVSQEDLRRIISETTSNVENFSKNHPEFKIGYNSESIVDGRKVSFDIQFQSFSMNNDELNKASDIVKQCSSTLLWVSSKKSRSRGGVTLCLEV